MDKQEEWQTMNASASWNHLLQDEKNETNHLPDFMILTPRTHGKTDLENRLPESGRRGSEIAIDLKR